MAAEREIEEVAEVEEVGGWRWRWSGGRRYDGHVDAVGRGAARPHDEIRATQCQVDHHLRHGQDCHGHDEAGVEGGANAGRGRGVST